MAKLITKTIQDNAYSTIRPFFDEVAEECSLLSVSNDGTTLILTIDTDLVISLGQYATSTSTPSFLGSCSITFGSRSLWSKSSVSTGYNPQYIVIYNDSLFFFLIKPGSNDNSIIVALYENLNNSKYANGGVGLPSDNGIYDLVGTANFRYPGLGYVPQGNNYIDYIDITMIVNNGVRYATDTNIIACTTVPFFKIITINNQDYFSITNKLLVPIDAE